MPHFDVATEGVNGRISSPSLYNTFSGSEVD